MSEMNDRFYDSHLSPGGLVAQGADGVWYGWQHVVDKNGSSRPYLVSEDGMTSFSLEQAAFYGLPLPAGYSVEFQQVPAQHDATTPLTTPERLIEKAPDTEQSKAEGVAQNPPTGNEQSAQAKLRVSENLGKVTNFALGYAERQKHPEQWLFYDGWGVATASFIRGNDVAREQFLHVLMSKSKIVATLLRPLLRSPNTIRSGAVVVAKTAPVAVPVEAATPIPGDAALTLGVTAAVIVAVAKRRNKIKHGLL